MSLVGTYVELQDHSWALDPVLGDEKETWFICYDDDDPIELVVAENANLTPEQILKQLAEKGFVLKIASKGHTSHRFFGSIELNSMKKADSYWLTVVDGAPNSDMLIEHDGFSKARPNEQGVYYPIYSKEN
jgi:predicted RNA binding protein YcfA (HicA-like mRNA interferase family)